MVLKTRERLIEVARQLFAHKGVAKTTMNDIANASDKGRRTIYTYFRSKKDIYNAVLESESDRLVMSLRSIVDSADDVDVRLRRFLKFRLEHNKVEASSSLKSWLKFDSRRVESINRMARTKESQMLSALLDEGCRAGVFRASRCKLLEGFINECIARLDIPKPEVSDPVRREAIFDAFVEFILSDIKA